MAAVLARRVSNRSPNRLPSPRRALILVKEKPRTKRCAKNSSDIWKADRKQDPPNEKNEKAAPITLLEFPSQRRGSGEPNVQNSKLAFRSLANDQRDS